MIFALSLSYGLVGGLVVSPADYLQGEGYRIIYLHAPCAFLSLFVYTIMTGCALLGIIFHLKIAFLIMKHAVKLGAVFTFLALLTGSLWGKPMWGTWWIWDARLTSELVLLLIYVGLILFQSAVAHKKSSDQLTAILVLFGFIDIPLIHYSVTWWNTLHQGATIKILAPSKIANSMLYPLISMMIALFTYFCLVMITKIRYELIVEQANSHWLRTKC